MILYKSNLVLEQQDCDKIKKASPNENLFDVFMKLVSNYDKSINIRRIASIQTPAKEIALSLQLMQCIKENK